MDKKCGDCEFCFPHPEFGFVCADENYGENISDTLNIIKPCYSEGFNAFVERTKQEEIIYNVGTLLTQLKIDGRKQIELIDKEEKIIQIKASKIKELFNEVIVLKKFILIVT
jgi:hypothetical protein